MKPFFSGVFRTRFNPLVVVCSFFAVHANLPINAGTTHPASESSQPFRLLDANDYGRPGRVLLRFAHRVDPSTATQISNYQTEPAGRITQIVMTDSPGVVELTVSQAVASVATPGVRDLDGLAVNSAAATPVSHEPLRPDGHGSVVAGFQDSFAGNSVAPEWKLRGVDGADMEAFPLPEVKDGVLHIASASTINQRQPNHLLYERPGYDAVHQEVLMRIRVISGGIAADGGRLVGAAAAVSFGPPPVSTALKSNYRGVNGGVNRDPSFNSGLPYLDFDLDNNAPSAFPRQTLSGGTNSVEQPGQWFWLRFRHEPDLNPGQSDIFMKAWAADGLTPEPIEWLSFNYADAPGQVRKGFAGIAAVMGSTVGIGFASEVDYVAILAAGLPKITLHMEGVEPPAFTAVPASLSAAAGEFVTLTAAVVGDGPLSFQWRRDGVLLAAANSTALDLGSVTSAMAGDYTLTVSNRFGSVTSPMCQVRVTGESGFADAALNILRPEWSRAALSNLITGQTFIYPTNAGPLRLNLASLNPALWKLCSADVAIQDGHFPVTRGSALGRWGVQTESGAVLMETSFSPNGSESMGFAYQEYPGLAGGPLFPPEFGAREKYQGNHDTAIYRVRFLIPPGTTNEALLFGGGSSDSFASFGVSRVSVSQLPDTAAIVRFRDRTLNVIENSGTFELVLERLGNLAPALEVEVHSRPFVSGGVNVVERWRFKIPMAARRILRCVTEEWFGFTGWIDPSFGSCRLR